MTTTGGPPRPGPVAAAGAPADARAPRKAGVRVRMVLWQLALALGEALVFWQHWAPFFFTGPRHAGLVLVGGGCDLTVDSFTLEYGLVPFAVWLLLRAGVTRFGLRHWPVQARSDRFKWRLSVSVVLGLFVAATVVLQLLGGLTFNSGQCSWWPPGQPVVGAHRP